MATKIHVKSDKNDNNTLNLVKSAITAEVIKLEMALELANRRLSPFEKKYKVTSEYFITNLASEDLEGGDDEYVSWAGEYKLWKRLEKKLSDLKDIEYENSTIL